MPPFPKAMQAWEECIKRSKGGSLRDFHLSHDEHGNWTVTLSGSVQCLYFPADPVSEPTDPTTSPLRAPAGHPGRPKLSRKGA
jgi:hypothetical protein